MSINSHAKLRSFGTGEENRRNILENVKYVTCIYVCYSLEEYAEAEYYLSTFKPQTLTGTMKLHEVKTDAGVLRSRQTSCTAVTSVSQAAAAPHGKDMVS